MTWSQQAIKTMLETLGAASANRMHADLALPFSVIEKALRALGAECTPAGLWVLPE